MDLGENTEKAGEVDRQFVGYSLIVDILVATVKDTVQDNY